MPRTTLITAVYNRAELLPEALQSVLMQSDPDFELIVWDDGSSDASLSVAERFAERDARIRIFSAPNQGFTGVLNAALAQSDSPYFGLVDSDDRLAPDALDQTVPIAVSDPDIGIVYSNHRRIDLLGGVVGPGWNHDIAYSAERLIVEQMVFHFRLFNREIFDETGGYDPAYPHAEDYDLMLKMSEISTIVKHEAVLYDYRVHDGMISVEKHAEQVESSLRAIDAALERRGVSDRLMVVVDAQNRFSLTTRF